MNEDRWTQLLQTARTLPASTRRAWLDQTCADDTTLRERLEASLTLEEPALENQRPSMSATVADGDSQLGTLQQDDGPLSAADLRTSQTRVAGLSPATPRRAGGEEHVGQWIGRYQLKTRLGEGGFGSVWLAEQRLPVRRHVALKLIKLGMDTREIVARFEAERQTLAQMNHPGIASVYDAGANEQGRPYFVMEHVEGVGILTFCDREALPLRERLHLFLGVCRAIQYAHQKGVIHRDIKPSNILVRRRDGQPEAKVIDFGIAKAIRSADSGATLGLTGAQQIIGTPAYMSPEQAAGSEDIDTRTDIYSLGVLLYELLTGCAPLDLGRASAAGLHEVLRVISEVEPVRPSTRVSQLARSGTDAPAGRPGVEQLRMQLRGDLDWIAMKCLEKQRERRYASAEALAIDIERHLADEPVSARPPDFSYRLGKFVRRHRLQVGAAALLLLTLVLGLIGTGIGWQRALDATARAEQAEAAALARSRELERVSSFQADQLQSIQPVRMGEALRDRIIELSGAEALEPTATLGSVNFTDVALTALDRELFARAQQVLVSDYADQPALRIRLSQSLATTSLSLGLLDRADALHHLLLEDHRQLYGPEHPDTLRVQVEQALVLVERGRLQDAEVALLPLVERLRAQLPVQDPRMLHADNALGWLLRRQGRHGEAEPILRRTVEARLAVLGEQDLDTLQSIDNMAIILTDLNRIEEAEQWAQRSLTQHNRVFGAEHLQTLIARNTLANVLAAGHRWVEAEALLREGVDTGMRVLGNDHRHVLRMKFLLARSLHHQGRTREALPYAARVDEGRRHTQARGDPLRLAATNQHAQLLLATDQPEKAAVLFRDLVGYFAELPTPHDGLIYRGSDLLVALRRAKQPAAAVQESARLLALAERFPADDWRQALLLAQRVISLAHASQAREARQLLTRALPLLETRVPPAEATMLRRRTIDELVRLFGADPAIPEEQIDLLRALQQRGREAGNTAG